MPLPLTVGVPFESKGPINVQLLGMVGVDPNTAAYAGLARITLADVARPRVTDPSVASRPVAVTE